MSMTPAEWFEERAKNTPMPGTREMFKVAAAALRDISNSETTTKWIPVTERLPKDNERVLVYHDDGMVRFGINKDGFADVVSTLYLKHNHRTCFSKVTHWMPLPEPPKGE